MARFTDAFEVHGATPRHPTWAETTHQALPDPLKPRHPPTRDRYPEPPAPPVTTGEGGKRAPTGAWLVLLGVVATAGAATGDEKWDDRFGPLGIWGGAHAIALSGNDYYVGGTFAAAGAIPMNHIARWNGRSWSALGSGIHDGGGRAPVVRRNDVLVGGNFISTGGVASYNIARWDQVD